MRGGTTCASSWTTFAAGTITYSAKQPSPWRPRMRVFSQAWPLPVAAGRQRPAHDVHLGRDVVALVEIGAAGLGPSSATVAAELVAVGPRRRTTFARRSSPSGRCGGRCRTGPSRATLSSASPRPGRGTGTSSSGCLRVRPPAADLADRLHASWGCPSLRRPRRGAGSDANREHVRALVRPRARARGRTRRAGARRASLPSRAAHRDRPRLGLAPAHHQHVRDLLPLLVADAVVERLLARRRPRRAGRAARSTSRTSLAYAPNFALDTGSDHRLHRRRARSGRRRRSARSACR